MAGFALKKDPSGQPPQGFAIENPEHTGDPNSFDRTMSACEIHIRSRVLPTRFRLWAGCFVLAGIASIGTVSPAKAVDLVNGDRKPYQVVVNRSDGSSDTVTVKAGQKVENICTDCVILVGNSSVETRGRATVKIEGGQVSIASQR